MGESAGSLFRRGGISSKAAGRFGVLKQTRVQPSKLADFDGKKKDEGGRSDSGATAVASTRHIDQNQKKGKKGMPSSGGSAGTEKQPIRRRQIDDGATQTPKFARGAGYKTGVSDSAGRTGYAVAPAKKLAAWKGKAATKKDPVGTPKKLKGGKVASNPSQYGDPASGRKFA